MNRIAKRILETVLGIATLTMPIKAQNIVNVHVQSVPSMNNTRARIKATDQSGNSYQRMTDATGTATLIVGTGNITLEERAEKNYLSQYTTTISGNANIQDYSEEVRTPASTIYNTWGQLELEKFLLLRRPQDPSQHLQKWTVIPIPVYNENPPAGFDTNLFKAYDDTKARTQGKFSYTIIPHDSTVGITNKWVPSDQIPFGSISYINFDDWFNDGSIKHVTILYANDLGILDTFTYDHELGWALSLHGVAQDPNYEMVSSTLHSDALSFHDDEILTIVDNQSFPQYFDYNGLINVPIDTVVNNAPLT
jgi:hypothetical protein